MCAAFHARAIRPSAATLIAVGDCEHAEIARLAAEAFADWAGGGPDARRRGVGRAAAPHARIAIVPRRAAPQSELRIGHVAAARDTPDYHALVVAQHGARRTVRQPHQPEPARGQGLHLRRADGVRVPPHGRVRSRCRRACRRAAPRSRSRSRSARSPAIRGTRPVTPEELSLGDRGADARLRAQLRDRRADRARRDAARALRSARRLLRAASSRRSSRHGRRRVARDDAAPRSRRG